MCKINRWNSKQMTRVFDFGKNMFFTFRTTVESACKIREKP